LGNINVYLSDGPWKKGAELKREPQPISFGSQTSVGVGNTLTRCVAPAVADLNGDGKFDIIVGKPNGRIAVAYNIGTPTEPKFGPLVELKGEDVLKKGSIREPLDWSPSFGYREGNFYGYYTVVTPAEDQEAAQANGKHVLKFGYQPVLNRIIRKPPLLLSGTTDSVPDPRVGFLANGVTPFYWGEVDRGSFLASSNVAILRQSPAPEALKPNGKYLLSFRVKGRNVKNGHATVLFGGWLLRDVEAAKAGTGTPENRSYEALRTDVDFPVTPAWVAVSKPVSFRFSRQPDLNEPEKWNKPGSKIEYRSLVDIRATLNIDDSAFYIDDVKLTPI
jgi:hypothetical protein